MLAERSKLLPGLSAMLQVFADTCPADVQPAGLILALLCRPWLEQQRLDSPIARSLLTPSGYPIEFSFLTHSDSISYTAEPGLPQASSAAKWRFARALQGELGPQLDPLLPLLMAQPAQRFGCWLGVRHAGGVPIFKIYQEVTASAHQPFLAALRRDVPGLDGGLDGVAALTPQLLGVVAGDGRVTEYYCRLERPEPAAVHRLFARAGIAHQLPSAVDYLAYLAGLPQDQLWQRLRIGISYAVHAAGPPTVTLFAHARELFRTDAVARMRLLGLARQIGGRMPGYESITRKLEAQQGPCMMHGLVGLKMAHTGDISAAVGLRSLDEVSTAADGLEPLIGGM